MTSVSKSKFLMQHVLPSFVSGDKIDRRKSQTSGRVMDVGFVIVIEADYIDEDNIKTRGDVMHGVYDSAIGFISDSDSVALVWY